MARLYGQVSGRSRTRATRCANDELHVVAQSYEGSVAITLLYDCHGQLMASLSVDKGSEYNPKRTFWHGPLADLVSGNILKHSLDIKE